MRVRKSHYGRGFDNAIRPGLRLRVALNARRGDSRLAAAEALRQPARQPVHPTALPASQQNDTTNAFKAYRREVIETVQPLLSKHFNPTVELPPKAIVRGHGFAVVPTSWTNRTSGEARLKMKKTGSRYLFITDYVWLE